MTNLANNEKTTKRIDFNSNENQTIKGEFVGREVYSCVSELVEYSLKQSYEDNNAPISHEDLSLERFEYNSSIISFDGLTYSEKEEAKEELEDLAEKIESFESYEVEEDEYTYIRAGNYTTEQLDEINKAIEEIENLDGNYIEVFEWWLVSPWLAKKLEEKGEIITETYTNKIWGRCATGQAILLDHVISEICNDLGLLK